MSVSIKLSPAAGAFRVLMGKNGFDNWIASMEVVKETSFNSKEELLSTIKKCGYQVEQYEDIFKTTFNSINYLLWEYRNNQWVAIFNKQDSQKVIKTFMTDLEQKAQRPIFSELTDQVKQTQNFPTNFRDIKLLKKVLDSNSLRFQEESSQLKCDFEKGELIFSQLEVNGPILVAVSSYLDMKKVFKQLSILDDDYKMLLQERTYQNLLEKAQQKGFVLEQEEVLADNSIVLTLNVRR